MRLRGAGDQKEENKDEPLASPLDDYKMQKALEKLDEMRAESERAKTRKLAREKAFFDHAVAAAANISKGYTLFGKAGVWYDDYETRFANATCRDPFTEVEEDGRAMCGSWAFYENRPIPLNPERLRKLEGNVKTR